MAFSRAEADALLVACHRRCCICHRWCGSKIELDHMTQSADGGSDDIENAIPVCFDCHAEIHAYDPRHPRGRRFTPRELRMHKDQWLSLCSQRPEMLVGTVGTADAGPVHALIAELEYNAYVLKSAAGPEEQGGALFHDDQFRRSIALGVLSMLAPDLRGAVMDAYAAMAKANSVRLRALGAGDGFTPTDAEAFAAARNVAPQLAQALRLLYAFLQADRASLSPEEAEVTVKDS